MMAADSITLRIAADTAALEASLGRAADRLAALGASAQAASAPLASLDRGAQAARDLAAALDRAGSSPAARRQAAETVAAWLDGLKREIGAETTTEAQKEALLRQYDAVAEATLAQTSRAYQSAKDWELREEKRIHDQKAALALAWGGQQSRLAQMALQSQLDGLEAEVAAGRIAAADRLRIATALYAGLYQLRRQDLENELAAQQAGTRGALEAYGRILELDQQQLTRLAAANKQAADQIAREWRSTNEQIAGDLTRDLMGAITGKGGMREAGIRLANQLIEGMIDNAAKNSLAFLERLVGIDSEAPGDVAGRLFGSVGLGGVASFLGIGNGGPRGAGAGGEAAAMMGSSHLAGWLAGGAKDASGVAATAQTAALQAQTAATVANTTATTTGTAATTTATGATSLHTGATTAAMTGTAANTVATGANTGGLLTGVGTWIGNTVATVANTVATEASAIGHFLGFAGGGDPPVGVPSIVGERGPELFVPRGAGTIVPSGGWGLRALRSPVAAAQALVAANDGGPRGQGGDLHFHYGPTVQALDAAGIDRVMRAHGERIARYVLNAKRNGARS